MTLRDKIQLTTEKKNKTHTPPLWELIVQQENLKERKRLFLERLKSKKGYRRYLGAPIRYPGGKSAAVGYIIELLPENVQRVISPFIGGGSVEVALAKELGIKVIAFDIFDILVTFWQVLLNEEQKKKMLSILIEFKPDKKTYQEVKHLLRLHWRYTEYHEGDPKNVITDKPLLAALFFFNYQLSYGPGFLGWPSSIYLNERAYLDFLEKLADFHVPNLEVHQADFREVLPRFTQDFLYLDPPYYIGSDSKVFRGIYPMRNFPIHHHGFPHETLRDMLNQHKGGFILSYNDCPTIRSYYPHDLHFFPRWHYSMGLGETRIGKNRKERENPSHYKESHEILIVRYPCQSPPC
ncbi:MAG: DNA adenine methylase [Thermus sp.]|uniref:DNA adenine methylase n=1 Tax=Thermus sp. TaxID=275 RepID=UPI00391CD30B